MLITPSFFVGEIGIPNPFKKEISEKINLFIEDYEPKCLEGILGYELYREFLSDPTTQRMQDLILGKEYYNNSRLTKWKGLVYTNNGSPLSSQIYGYLPKDSQQVQVDVTTGLTSGTTSFTFDGTEGKPDWRGYKLLIDRTEFGIMIEGRDYSFDISTGTFQLLQEGDKLATLSWLTAIFTPKPITNYVGQVGVNYFSLIANYIFYFIKSSDYIWNSELGTVIPKGDNVIPNTPAFKMNWSYNRFAREGRELCYFLYSNIDVYPEFDDYEIQNSSIIFTKTKNDFDI